MDLGETVGVEISYPELWKMKAKLPFVQEHLGAHTRYVFKDCVVIETSSPEKTILMKFEEAGK